MFWKKSEKSEAKQAGPRPLPEPVHKHLVAEKNMDAEWITFLRAVTRNSPQSEKVQEIRIFDPAEAEVKKAQVKNYTSLDEHRELIIYEGSFDEASKKVELAEKKKVVSNVTLLTQDEIQKKIEALSQPSSTIFFYQARGSAHGGPLGMGAAVIELNPAYPGKNQKKYNIYTADVFDSQPVDKGQKLWDSDKPKEVAKWVLEALHKRMY